MTSLDTTLPLSGFNLDKHATEQLLLAASASISTTRSPRSPRSPPTMASLLSLPSISLTTKMISASKVGVADDVANIYLSPSRTSSDAASSTPTLVNASTKSTPPSSIAAEDPVVDEKKAKRKAKRELNRLRRRAEVQAKAEAPKLQLWEQALDKVSIPKPGPAPPVDDDPLPPGFYDINDRPAVAFVEHLLSLYGRWNITFLDASYRIFLAADAAISFKVVKAKGRRVAVVFGNPLCAPDALEDTISTFQSVCRRNGWGLAFVGVRSDVYAIAQKRKWATVRFADEPMLDPATNPVLDGSRGRRNLLHIKKLAKSESLHILPPGTASPAIKERLQNLYEQCYASRTSPYSTKLNLFALREVTYLYLGDEENPTAVAGLVHTAEGGILDPCVASPEAPAAATDFLTIMAMGYARRQGIRCSFGPEPLRDVEVSGMSGTMARGTRLVSAAAFDAFSFEGKRLLHDKFHPARREQQFVVLASHHTIGQAGCAMAVWEATHLHSSEVVGPFWKIVKSKFGHGDKEPRHANPLGSSPSVVTLEED